MYERYRELCEWCVLPNVQYTICFYVYVDQCIIGASHTPIHTHKPIIHIYAPNINEFELVAAANYVCAQLIWLSRGVVGDIFTLARRART